MFAAVSVGITARLTLVQKLHAHIVNLEHAGVSSKDPTIQENAAILRGLFYVHLYGTFEYGVSQCVHVLLQEMTKLGAKYMEFENLLHSVALDGAFKSAASSHGSAKWEKRKALLRKQRSIDVCPFDDSVFNDQLQNVWFDTLKNVFDCLCIPVSPVPDNRHIGYIDEVVSKRNEVAHGDSSPLMVGRLTSSSDLLKRFEAIRDVLNHVVAVFDNHLKTRGYIEVVHRAKYP